MSVVENRGMVRAEQKTKTEVEWSSYQSFQLYDLQRIGQRDLTRKIIVETPRNTGSDDGKWAKDVVCGRST